MDDRRLRPDTIGELMWEHCSRGLAFDDSIPEAIVSRFLTNDNVNFWVDILKGIDPHDEGVTSVLMRVPHGVEEERWCPVPTIPIQGHEFKNCAETRPALLLEMEQQPTAEYLLSACMHHVSDIAERTQHWDSKLVKRHQGRPRNDNNGGLPMIPEAPDAELRIGSEVARSIFAAGP